MNKADAADSQKQLAQMGEGFQTSILYIVQILHFTTELAVGNGKQRIYVVEPTGEFEDDPNVTDKKFPGNPTKFF